MATKKVTPLDRALEAGRLLMAEGEDATGAAIRTRAGVAMATAVEAARVLRHEAETTEAEAPEAGEVPDAVSAAAALVWRAALEAAREDLAADRLAYLARVKEAETQRDEAQRDLAETAAEVDRLSAEVEEQAKRLRQVEAQNARLVEGLKEKQAAPAKRTPAKRAAKKAAPVESVEPVEPVEEAANAQA